MMHRRFGGDPAALAMILDKLAPIRDDVVGNAAIREGDVVLDVGCGDGLIAFALLDRIGKNGKVIFLDISEDLLDHCKRKAAEAGQLARCEFVRSPAQDLSALKNDSIDAITMRSTLIFIKQKQRVFDEFYRVLKSRGRVSLFEPVNRVVAGDLRETFKGYALPDISDLVGKVGQVYERFVIEEGHTQLDFDEIDLFKFANRSGFSQIHLKLGIDMAPVEPLANWPALLRTAPSPGAPTLEEAIRAALTPEEAERYKSVLRQAVESGKGIELKATAFLWCVK